MVLKVSISLRGETVITVEASEPQVLHQVLELALRELPKDLMQIQMGNAAPTTEGESRKNADPMTVEGQDTNGARDVPVYPATTRQEGGTEAEKSFARFCASLSPLGDMRRVVVAAEGAGRFLGMEGVSEMEMGRLFELAGWRQPGDFLQSLRNAARSKFRWVERVPGTTGYYAVTKKGVETVIAPLER